MCDYPVVDLIGLFTGILEIRTELDYHFVETGDFLLLRLHQDLIRD